MNKLMVADLKYYKDRILSDNLIFFLHLNNHLDLFTLLALPLFFSIVCGIVFFIFNLLLIYYIFKSLKSPLSKKFKLCSLIFLNNLVQLFELSLSTILHQSITIEAPTIANGTLPTEQVCSILDENAKSSFLVSFLHLIFRTKTFFKW